MASSLENHPSKLPTAKKNGHDELVKEMAKGMSLCYGITFSGESFGTKMQTYQYDFDRVEQYLHHRSPYLLVEQINSIDSSEIITQWSVSQDQFFVPGHFPGAPIVPGALMQEFTTQSAGVLIAARYNPMSSFDTEDPFHNEYALGVLANVQHARYKGMARPGDVLIARVTLNERMSNFFDFSAAISVRGKIIMQNAFRLMNIKSSLLYEKVPSESETSKTFSE